MKLFFTTELVQKIIREPVRIPKENWKGISCLQLRCGEAGAMSLTMRSGQSLSICGQCRWRICKSIDQKMNETNRKELPAEIEKPKFRTTSTVAYRRGNTLVLEWKEKRVFTCLITKGDTGMATVKRITRGDVDILVRKPNIVLNYTKYCGVDRADQYASSYCFLRKSLKWWRSFSFEAWKFPWSIHTFYINQKRPKEGKSQS